MIETEALEGQPSLLSTVRKAGQAIVGYTEASDRSVVKTDVAAGLTFINPDRFEVALNILAKTA